MRPPGVDLRVVSVLLGWILVVGGLLEVFGLVYYRPWGPGYVWGYYHGPALMIGLGLVLWLQARR